MSRINKLIIAGILALGMQAAWVRADESAAPTRLSLENASLRRTFSVENGILRTTEIENKLAKVTTGVSAAPEFRLRVSRGTDKPESAVTLTTEDFRIAETRKSPREITFCLKNDMHKLRLEVRYLLASEGPWLRKWVTLTSSEGITLERVDVEALALPDAVQPHTHRKLTTTGQNFNPGLGQPLYTTRSGAFFGVEFPASDNFVSHGTLTAGYYQGRELRAGAPYTSYPAVMGVADDPAFVADAFRDYINRIRIRPLRLQLQYNSWFDFAGGVDQEKFAASVAKIHSELTVKRGTPPFSAYVIDDGWQDAKADWTKTGYWPVNNKFDSDFKSSFKTVADARSRLGLWMNPGCVFGAEAAVPALRAGGYEALGKWMSLTGPRHMQAFENRILELTRMGVVFYKLDGIFGHAARREFELRSGDAYGMPPLPHLQLGGFTSRDPRLSEPQYDELKLYYITRATENLMGTFRKMAGINPDIYIVISNASWLSPWWLMHVDAVWMNNAGDEGSGGRTRELVYRDERYHEFHRRQNNQFPLCSIFNHEPKKTKPGENSETFRRYFYMCLSRGTGFLEIYIKPPLLAGEDWDIIAGGIRWSREFLPAFARVRMHGGNPGKNELYGYTAWTADRGYISIHNPGDKPAAFACSLDRAFGLVPASGSFTVTSPLSGDGAGLPASVRFGDTLSVTLEPKEIRILEFRAPHSSK